MRIITSGIMHETHTFASERTPLEAFAISRGNELFDFAGTNHSVGGVVDQCAADGIDLAPGFFASAVPSGTPTADTFETLVNELCESIDRLRPADGVILTLHGAMVAGGAPDAEAEVVKRVRKVVGQAMPIAVTLDFHANIGQEMVDGATVITTYDTYPHTDAAERAREAVRLLASAIDGDIMPVMAMVKPPLLPVPQAMYTSRHPFETLFSRAHELEASGQALTVTIAGGFPYADIPQAGVTLLVTTDGDNDGAQNLANELAKMAWSFREEMTVRNVPPSQAVSEAIASEVHPVVLVDVADNIGGGTPGDGTVLLRELIGQQAEEATIVIADAESTSTAISAGIGGSFVGNVGGKSDDLHGDPVRVEGTVFNTTDGRWVHEGPENAGVPVDMGPTAVVRAGSVNLILTTRKCMPGDLQQLRSQGIEPSLQNILVVKSAVRWRGGYGPITKRSIDVDTPGLGTANLQFFEFDHIRRPIFPLDDIPEWTPQVGQSGASPR